MMRIFANLEKNKLEEGKQSAQFWNNPGWEGRMWVELEMKQD